MKIVDTRIVGCATAMSYTINPKPAKRHIIDSDGHDGISGTKQHPLLCAVSFHHPAECHKKKQDDEICAKASIIIGNATIRIRCEPSSREKNHLNEVRVKGIIIPLSNRL